MFDHKHYVPILKGKDAEYRSLEDLSGAVKLRLTPLIEVPPVSWDHINDCAAKTVDEHVQRITERILNSWGIERPLFLDFDETLHSESLANGTHVLTSVFNEARGREIQAIPVSGIGLDNQYQVAVQNAIAQDRRGVCIRLSSEQFAAGDLTTRLDELLNFLGCTPPDVHLVLDFGPILGSQMDTIVLAVRAVVVALPHVTRWQTLTFAATAFPENLSGFTPNTLSPTPRSEWLVWQSLANNRDSIPRLPTFGDYGIQHPALPDIDPRIMQVSANIRYTHENEWLILKGRSVRVQGFAQFHHLSQSLVNRQEYSGRNFSWGDAYIEDCANQTVGTGNHTTWRRVGTTHHLSYVTEQIANLPGL